MVKTEIRNAWRVEASYTQKNSSLLSPPKSLRKDGESKMITLSFSDGAG